MVNNNFIIPAIDIIAGKAVRLTQGDYQQQTTYDKDPLDWAKNFEDAGFSRIHLVDLDGAKAGSIQNIKVLEAIANNTSLIIDFGGGIKTKEAVKNVFNAGAGIATVGSIAVKQPAILTEWIAEFGADKFFIGADVFDESIKINGWAEDGNINIFSFIENMSSIGAQHFFCTDISKDGALQGTSIELYQKIITRFSGISLTASGGVATLSDIAAAKEAGCKAVIVGKAIYEGRISLRELAAFHLSSI